MVELKQDTNLKSQRSGCEFIWYAYIIISQLFEMPQVSQDGVVIECLRSFPGTSSKVKVVCLSCDHKERQPQDCVTVLSGSHSPLKSD